MLQRPLFKKLLFSTLILFVFGDLIYSFVQHLNSTLDGDMPAIIVPSPWHSEVLKDPFGFSVLTEGKRYTGTNRFFAHWSESKYYKTAPLLLQTFVNPIDSVYLAGAVFKIGLQIFLLWLLSAFISGSLEIRRLEFWIAAALVTPMFQVSGFNESLTIMMYPTYTFFYPLPLALLLLFFLPFYRGLVNGHRLQFSWWQRIGLLLLGVILPFSGPLVPPLVLIVCPAILLYYFFKSYRGTDSINTFEKIWRAVAMMPRHVLFYFVLISIVSVYSFYIGLFNIENATDVSIAQRYAVLWTGLVEQLFKEPAFPMLFLLIALNIFLTIQHRSGSQMLTAFKWILIFSAIYILMLPLGGFREYRPLVIRGDTFMPVTFCIIYIYGVSTLHVLFNVLKRNRAVFASAVIVLIVVFTVSDKFVPVTHRCEKEGLFAIAASPDPVVRLDLWCSILEWHPIIDPYGSNDCGNLLYIWRITNEKKLYTTSK